MDVIVRELREEDFENGFFETLSNLSSVTMQSEKAKHILKAMHNQNTHVFVAVTPEGHVVGTTTLLIEQKFIHDGGLAGHIENVATRKDHEGKGIGRAVVSAAKAYALAHGCYKVILDCDKKNIPFYEKQGFHVHETCMRADRPNH